MKLFYIYQKEYSDFMYPDRVNSMLISAESEEDARKLAKLNEDEHRDGQQSWDSDSAICREIELPEKIARIYLVS